MCRWKNWSNIEIKIFYLELVQKKQKSDEDLGLIDSLKKELDKRGVKIND